MVHSVSKRGSMTLVLAAFVLAGQAQLGMAGTHTSTAQPPAGLAPVATETLTYDHVHFGVPDPAKAVEWYAKYLGGQPGPAGEPNDRLLFGKTRFIFLKTDRPLPSAGSAVDHIGLSVPDLAAKIKELQTAGIKILTPIQDERGLFKHAFIEDPWGAKIEVLQDPETLGFHHVHLRAPDPEGAFKWYLEMFGGERRKLKGRVDALKYGDVWILAEEGEATPSEGHAIRSYRLADHNGPKREGRRAQSQGQIYSRRTDEVVSIPIPPLPRNLTAPGCRRTLSVEFAHHSGVAQGTTWRLCRR